MLNCAVEENYKMNRKLSAKLVIQLLLVTFYKNRKNFPYHIY